MNDRLLSLLGLMKKAGRLQLGNDPTLEAIQSRKARLVLTACDLSPKTRKGIERAAADYGAELRRMEQSMDEVSMALGKRCGVLAVTDEGFAKKARTLTRTDGEEPIL